MEKKGFLFHLFWGAVLAGTTITFHVFVKIMELDMNDSKTSIYATIIGNLVFISLLAYAMQKAERSSFGKSFYSGLLMCFFNLILYVPVLQFISSEISTSISGYIVIVIFYITIDTVFCLIIAPFVSTKSIEKEDILDR
jgi:hypothetical protein